MTCGEPPSLREATAESPHDGNSRCLRQRSGQESVVFEDHFWMLDGDEASGSANARVT
jgi:hypothetical protein